MFAEAPNSYYGDLSTSVNRGIDGAMVRNGRIRESRFQGRQRAMSNTSKGPCVRPVNLVRGVR